MSSSPLHLIRAATPLLTLVLLMLAALRPTPTFAQDGEDAAPMAETAAMESEAEGDDEEGAAPAGEVGEDLQLFGEQFELRGEDMTLEIEENNVRSLDAYGDVRLEMDQFTVTGARMKYVEAEKQLITWGDETQRCIVVQSDAVSRCDQFIYNTETGETRFIGNPEIEFKRPEDEQANKMKADNISIEQNQETKRTVVRLRTNAVIGSDSMLAKQLDNPNANNPSIALGESSEDRPDLPGAVIDDKVTTQAIRITEENAADMTNATTEDLEGIEGERPFGGLGAKSSADEGDDSPF